MGAVADGVEVVVVPDPGQVVQRVDVMQRRVPRVPQPYDSLVFPIPAAGAATGLVWMRALTLTYLGI